MARDIKAYLDKNVREAVSEFTADPEIKTIFGEPVLGYVSTAHPLFDTFFGRRENDHPKNIYRPAYSIVVNYIPYYMGENKEQALQSFYDSVKLTMKVNGVIKECLYSVGRLYSGTCKLVDWDFRRHGKDWWDNLAAYLAGMGEFGAAASFTPSRDFYIAQRPELFSDEEPPYWQPDWNGRTGTILTDGLYAEKPGPYTAEELEAEFEKVMTACGFRDLETALAGLCTAHPFETSVAQDASSPETTAAERTARFIASCPAGAISEKGIDREACQSFCSKINSRTPNPDVCGRCYRVL